MSTPKKLNNGDKHLMQLIQRDRKEDGWATCSALVAKMLKTIPPEMVEFEPVGDEGRGRARLTTQGQSVLDAMAWL